MVSQGFAVLQILINAGIEATPFLECTTSSRVCTWSHISACVFAGSHD